MATAATAPVAGVRPSIGLLLSFTDAIAAVLLAADLAVVIGSVTLRSLFNAPVEWSDDIARGLMVGSSFFGAASALARGENAGVAFFVDRLPSHARRIIDSVSALLIVVIASYVAFHSIELGYITTGQTTGSGLPLEWTFYPMGVGAACMTVFALDQYLRRGPRNVVQSLLIVGGFTGLWLGWNALAPSTVPGPGPLMFIGFALSMCGGMAIGFALALATLIFHLGGRRAAWRDLRSANGARHRQLRSAGDPVLHPGWLPDGGERNVGSPYRICSSGWSAVRAAG